MNCLRKISKEYRSFSFRRINRHRYQNWTLDWFPIPKPFFGHTLITIGNEDQPNILAPLPERLSDTSIVSNIFALGVFPIYLNEGKKEVQYVGIDDPV